MERDCRDEIDGHLRRAVTALASARCALERKTEARRAITKSVRSPLRARARELEVYRSFRSFRSFQTGGWNDRNDRPTYV